MVLKEENGTFHFLNLIWGHFRFHIGQAASIIAEILTENMLEKRGSIHSHYVTYLHNSKGNRDQYVSNEDTKHELI